MPFITSPPESRFGHGADCHDPLVRLIGNLSGCSYRRRHDARWTREFVSAGCRDVAGCALPRFIARASLVSGDLIASADPPRRTTRSAPDPALLPRQTGASFTNNTPTGLTPTLL